MNIYVVGMSTGHGCELTSGDCAYLSFEAAEKKVREYHADKMDYIKVFTLQIQDKENIPTWKSS